jgi:hypothetical protein
MRRSVVMAVSLSLLVAGCAATASASPRSTAGRQVTSAKPAPSYPASFVGSAMNSDRQGLQIFASGTGQILRSLVNVKDAFWPQVSGSSVYYDTDGPGENCSAIMRIPYRGGRPVVVHRFGHAAAEDAFAVSRDGRMLAYAWSPQPPINQCEAESPSFLTVVNLVTGKSHTISGFPDAVSSLAWSADDRHLVLDFIGRQDNSEAEVLADPFRNASYQPVNPLPCPDGVRSCAEFTPQYDQAGHIVFLACLQPDASTCRFVLAETTGSRSVALASSVGLARSQEGGWSTIDSAGNSAIFTVPRGDGWATYRWTSGHVVRLSQLVDQPSW